MTEFDWNERFPDMKPVRTAPPLMRINGCGCGVYGSRDHDEETGTYVKTFCLSALFLPIFALTAYRVAQAPNGGWYFIGRVPLSAFAKAWNVLVLLVGVGIAGLVAWNSHTHSADYVAGQRLAEADAAAAHGQFTQAAQLYRDVATGTSSHRAAAREHLQGLLDNPALQNSLRDAVGVFRIVVDAQPRLGLRAEDLEERGWKLVEKHGDNDPKAALDLLETLQPIAKDGPKLMARRQAILEHRVAADPQDIDSASRLAVVYEESNQLPRCEKLLTPLKDRLGDSEGARILGQILLRKDKTDEACTLLEAYTDKKLLQLRSADATYRAATSRIIENVKKGTAPDFPYETFKRADEAGKQTIFRDYMNTKVQSDPQFKQSNEAYQETRRVVPAALDLGIALLHRAQTRPDAAKREKDLQKAEQVFLAIQNDEAAESNAYRLSLGQVYYWLGKHEEGKKKFDEVLAAEKRSPQMLLLIARTLREVGERTQACALSEEGYDKETEPQKKFAAALFRSLMARELDDKITWLERADPQDDRVKGSLSEARAEKAIEQGKLSDAEPHLRQAIELYAHLPEDPGTLNNGALAHLTLYRVTGERKELEKAETMLDKAVALAPRNSILLENAAHQLLDAAVREVLGAALDWTILKESGDVFLLSYFYDDPQGHRRLTVQFRQHPATVKATAFLERLLVLAPKNSSPYRQLASLYYESRDLAKLRDLSARLKRGTLDLASEETQARELFAGKRDTKYKNDMEAQRDYYAKRLEAAGKGKHGITYAVAASEHVRWQIGLAVYGAAVNADEVVKLAESAHEAAPSYATRSHLEMALLFRAGQNLQRKEPAFAALLTATRHALSVSDLIAFLVVQEGKLRAVVLADPDVKRARELIAESCHKFSDMPNAWAWAMLRTEEQQATRLAKVLREDERDALVRELNLKLYPFSADAALRAAWRMQALGKDKEAADILKQCRERGVPLPQLP